MAAFVRGFHDLCYEETSWPAIDAADFVERLCSILKSGDILGVVNCAAGSGVSVDVANTLHRIDPGIIRSDPSVRRKTGRVVMKFIKPAS